MCSMETAWDTQGHWGPYSPSAQAPWDLRRVVHLHRRAAFAATWKELQRDLADGPGPSITRLLRGEARSEGVPENFENIADQLAAAAHRNLGLGAADPRPLKAWWILRMYRGPDPLGERLTLLWHNHFATSNEKVNDLAAMWRQNELFRKYARAPFAELLNAVVHDPALLIWLDAPTNRKGRPNENLARELMELFTLGIGNYTETDVKEAARTLTGWKVGQGKFRDWAADHDDGEKILFGRKGPWKGEDLIRMLLENPATSRRLATRVCELLMGEGAVTAAALDALAAGLRQHDLNIGWAVETVLRSGAFFAEHGSYDTHYVQLQLHANLLGELSGGLKAFLDDLAAAKLADRVLVLCFSEFGRRVQENGSHGTDHGTAGPVFLAGPAVRPGLVGETPRLLDLEDGDLKMRIDFRRVYASVLEDWLGVPSKPVLGGGFAKLPLLRG